MTPELKTQEQILQGSNIPVLGCFFWAELPGKMTWNRQDFENCMVRNCIPANLSPVLGARTPVLRGLRRLASQKLVDIVSEDKEDLRIQATETYNNDYEITFTKAFIVNYNKPSEILTTEPSGLEGQIIPHIDVEKKQYRTEDLRRLIGRYLEKYGQPIRAKSGLFFVPACNQADIERLVNFLEALSSSINTASVPVIDAGKVKERLAKQFVSQVKESIKELAEEIKEIKAKDKKTNTILSKRLENIKKLKSKIDLYRQALSVTTQEVDEKVNALETELKQALGV